VTGSTITDTHNYGALTVVIQKSSNVGATKVAQKLSPQEMWVLQCAGLRPKPQIQFPGAVSGRLRAWKTWKPIEQATMSYGYGLSASLFQMAFLHRVLQRRQRHSLDDSENKRASRGRACDLQGNAEAVLHMLRLAAAGRYRPEGPGRGLHHWRQVGHCPQAGGQELCRGQVPRLVHGHCSIDKPRIIVAVMVDEPTAGSYGGTVAGPVFADVVQQTLRFMGVQPDKEVKPQIVAAPAEEPVL
jgi:cell division protein FtsI (penicillin-binding protein 3)